MSIRARKIVYQVHMDQTDDDGNVIAELATQEPLTIYAHQLDELAAQVAAVVEQAETKVDDGQGL